MGDYGIAISDKDSDVNKLEDILFTTKYVTVKLDTAKDISFRNIILTFHTDPTEPSPTGAVETRVASLPHEYSYRPSFWSLVSVLLPTSPNYQRYFQEQGVISSQTLTDDNAFFSVKLDKDNVNFYVNKVIDAGGSPNNIVGMKIRIRLYIFAEDLGI